MSQNTILLILIALGVFGIWRIGSTVNSLADDWRERSEQFASALGQICDTLASIECDLEEKSKMPESG